MANIVQAIKEELTFENVLRAAIRAPGVKIKRDVFLRKELKKYCSDEIISKAIRYNPAKAGISKRIIKIRYLCLSSIMKQQKLQLFL